MANLVYGSTDLSAIGAFATPELSGLLDLVTMEQAETWLPGRDAPALTDVRRRFPDIRCRCVLRADNGARATFLSNLATLKAALSPALGPLFLTRSDVSGKRLLVQSLGFPVNEDTLPYIMEIGEFTLTFRRLGWWEDSSAQTATVAAGDASGSITNSGQLVAYPTYTCTVGAGALASGLTFTVGGDTFTYDGALDAADVLVVETDLPSVSLNGTTAIADTATNSDFPVLAVGANTVTDKTVGFTLGASWRRRYE